MYNYLHETLLEFVLSYHKIITTLNFISLQLIFELKKMIVQVLYDSWFSSFSIGKQLLHDLGFLWHTKHFSMISIKHFIRVSKKIKFVCTDFINLAEE